MRPSIFSFQSLFFITLSVVLCTLIICLTSGRVLSQLNTAKEPSPKASWASTGLLINDTPGNTPQQNPQIISDEQGNCIIAWEDGHSGYYDIYAQKLSETGVLLWPKDGVAVCRFDSNQNNLRMISDQAGGAIIVWQDYRSGQADIYAQRIGPAGQLYWGEGGSPICTAAFGQFAPEITSDGAGGAFITWHDYRGGKGEDIYVQRINDRGTPLFAKDGVPVCQNPGTQWYPKIASDNAGGAVIVWTDGRKSANNNDIYAQRVAGDGKSLWGENGLAVVQAVNNQERPTILFSENGFVIAWNDFRSGQLDIYAQKIGLGGDLLWAEEGVPVAQGISAQGDPKLAPNGEGGAVIVWADKRTNDCDIYAQQIDRSGKITWQTNGRAICRTEQNQTNPSLAKLKNDEWIIIWEDGRRDAADLFAQKINRAGLPLWEKEGLPFSSGRHAQEAPVLTIGSTGNAFVAWQDRRSGNYDIYAQKISPAGGVSWGEGLLVCNTLGSVIQQNINLIDNGRDEIILAFEDARSGFFNIYLQKVSSTGHLAWGKNGVAASFAAANQSNPSLVSDGLGGAFVAWEDQVISSSSAIRVQHLSVSGKKMWDIPFVVCEIKSRQVNPHMISDGENGVIIVWQDDRNALDGQDIYAQRISSKGKALWGKNGKKIIQFSGNQVDVAIVADGCHGAFITWTDYRQGDRNPDIYAQRIDPQGDPLWKDDGVLLCGAPDIQRSPKIVRDEDEGIIVAWTDKGGGSYDIYAQRVDKEGRPLWITDGIPINQMSRTQQNPLFGNSKVLVWEDYRFGNWDIFAGTVDHAGKLRWGEEGVPVVDLASTQYAPQITEWKNGSVIVAWEDYRNDQFYEIYIQKVNSQGRPAWDKNGIKVQSMDGARAAKMVANPQKGSFYLFWEDFSGGGRALYGQKYLIE